MDTDGPQSCKKPEELRGHERSQSGAGIFTQAVNPLKSAYKLLNRFVEIKDFGNRGVSNYRLIIALHVVLRLVIACIFAGAVNRDHAGMETAGWGGSFFSRNVFGMESCQLSSKMI